MNKKIAFIFPGQGSQYVGMNPSKKNLIEISKEVYSQSYEILNYDIEILIEKGPSDKLNETCYTQPAIFIQSIIYNKYLDSINILPSATAGHSLGEYSALVSAKALSFKDALNIVKIRAEAMHMAGTKKPGMMAAVIGANNEQIDLICNQKGIVVPANYNSKNQIVISGEVNAVNAAIKTGKENGIRKIIPLKVSAAFHSPLMKNARKSLEKVIKSTKFKNTNIPIYQNVDAKETTDGETIKINLIKQLENPVLWYQTIENMHKNNYSYFLEVGPSKVLSNLNKKILPGILTDSIENKLEYKNV